MERLISVTVPALELGDRLTINKQRKGPFDVFQGIEAPFFNSFFKYNWFNGTCIESSEFGDCSEFANGTCTGVVEMLRQNKVDLNLVPLALQFPQGFNITNNYPFDAGPMMDDISVDFISLPHEDAYILRSNILATLRKTSSLIHVLNIIALVLFHFLLNASFKIRNGKITLVHGRKVSWINSISTVMTTGQLIVSVKGPHRFLTVFTMFLCAFLAHATFSGYFQSNMVHEFPPQYYNDLDDILYRVTNKSVLAVQGWAVLSKMINFKGSKYQQLKRILQPIEKHKLMTLHQYFKQGYILMESMIIVDMVEASACALDKTLYSSLKRSLPMYTSHTYISFSSNVSQKVKERFSTFSLRLFQSGSFKYRVRVKTVASIAEVIALGKNDPYAYYRCLGPKSVMKWPLPEFNQFTLAHFELLFAILGVGCFVASVTFLGECIYSLSSNTKETRKHRKHPKRVSQRKIVHSLNNKRRRRQL